MKRSIHGCRRISRGRVRPSAVGQAKSPGIAIRRPLREEVSRSGSQEHGARCGQPQCSERQRLGSIQRMRGTRSDRGQVHRFDWSGIRKRFRRGLQGPVSISARRSTAEHVLELLDDFVLPDPKSNVFRREIKLSEMHTVYWSTSRMRLWPMRRRCHTFVILGEFDVTLISVIHASSSVLSYPGRPETSTRIRTPVLILPR